MGAQTLLFLPNAYEPFNGYGAGTEATVVRVEYACKDENCWRKREARTAAPVSRMEQFRLMNDGSAGHFRMFEK